MKTRSGRTAKEISSEEKDKIVDMVKKKIKDNEGVASEIDEIVEDQKNNSDSDSDSVDDEVDSIVNDLLSDSGDSDGDSDSVDDTDNEADDIVNDLLSDSGDSEEPEDSEKTNTKDESEKETKEPFGESDDISTRDLFDFFDRVVDMVTLLVKSSPPKESKTASIDSVACRYVDKAISLERIAEHLCWSSRGLQVTRKDKDLMSDTGGTSKGRPKEPDAKPPRDEMSKTYNTKKKTPSQRDPDTDSDPDKRKD